MFKKNFLYFFLIIIEVYSNKSNVYNHLLLKENYSRVIVLDSTNTDSLDISLYKIYDFKGNYINVDTTISVKKDYKMNFLRKDYFNIITSSNMGHFYNKLSRNLINESVYQKIGFNAKQEIYTNYHDIKYFNVPTPLSEMFFKTTFDQGQLLNSLITVNPSPNFNYAFGYTGMRSLGKYIHSRSNNTNFRASFLIKSKSENYNAKIHLNNQRISNQENGGITPTSKKAFIEGDPDFIDRSLIENRFKDAESFMIGKRSYINHFFYFEKNNEKNFLIGQELFYETKSFNFVQSSPNIFFGDTFSDVPINDLSKLSNFNNKFYFKNLNTSFGSLSGSIDYKSFKYEILNFDELNSVEIPNKIYKNNFFIGANFEKEFSKIKFELDFIKSIKSISEGDKLMAKIIFIQNEKFKINSSLGYKKSRPDFNYILHKSNYKKYNWFNEDFKNENLISFSINFIHNRFGEISIENERINNYTYFKALPSVFFEKELSQIELNLIALGIGVKEQLPDSSLLVVPIQETNLINYLKINYSGNFRFGKFSLNNSFLYQNISFTKKGNQDGNTPLNLPDLILRSTFSFISPVFDKAMILNTGITATYHTEYYGDFYNPLIGGFSNQNEYLVGGYPRIDLFINAKVQQTRLYLKAEHINSSLTGYKYFASPFYPYRDFVIRFGIVWNFFK